MSTLAALAFFGLFLLGCSVGAGAYFWNAAIQAADAEKDKTEWQVAVLLNAIPDYEAYLRGRPAGRYAAEAAKRISRLAARESDEWGSALQSNMVAAYEAFLRKYPASRYATEASNALGRAKVEAERRAAENAQKELVEWSAAERANTMESYRGYLTTWPAGPNAATANQRLHNLADEEEAVWRETVKAGTRQSFEGYLQKYSTGGHAAEARQYVEEGAFAVPLSVEAESKLYGGAEFRECVNCPKMVVLPAGEFTMGSAAADIRAKKVYADEGPAHKVTFAQPFAIGKFEVTFAEWDACVAEGGCRGYRPGDEGWGRGKLPVINVSWDDAKLYVRWLSVKTGKAYRLLSEAEWEYAARAKTTTRFFFGDDAKSLCRYANIADESGSSKIRGREGFNSWMLCNDGHFHTAPVGSLVPNNFQLHDMIGNVAEWVEDVWHENYEGAPLDGSAWISNGDTKKRVGRGGSYFDLEVTVSYRNSYSAFSQGNLMGFRVGRSIQQ